MDRVIGICRRCHKGSSMHRCPRYLGSLEGNGSSSTAHPNFFSISRARAASGTLLGRSRSFGTRSPSWSFGHLTSVVGMTRTAWPNIPVLTDDWFWPSGCYSLTCKATQARRAGPARGRGANLSEIGPARGGSSTLRCPPGRLKVRSMPVRPCALIENKRRIYTLSGLGVCAREREEGLR